MESRCVLNSLTLCRKPRSGLALVSDDFRVPSTNELGYAEKISDEVKDGKQPTSFRITHLTSAQGGSESDGQQYLVYFQDQVIDKASKTVRWRVLAQFGLENTGEWHLSTESVPIDEKWFRGDFSSIH